MARLEPGETRKCSACGEPLIGARTAEGRIAPVELKPTSAGNVLLFRGAPLTLQAGVLQARVVPARLRSWFEDEGVPLRLNHFASCPQAARFRHTPAAIAATLTGEAAA